MKARRAFLGVFITALVVALILIAVEAYYVVVALVIGTLLLGHRELWSLVRRRRLPPIDERVRENTGKSVRNGFIFIMMAIALLMLPFTAVLTEKPETVRVLGGLFIAAGLVYLFSYLYYDRVQPALGSRSLRLLKIFLMTAGISLGVFIISIFLHNALFGLFIRFFGADFWEQAGMPDEPVFFFISVFISPLGFGVGIIGSLVIFIRGLLSKAS
jgi:hypothetical protein